MARVLFLGSDLPEISHARRIEALMAYGHEVTAAGTRKGPCDTPVCPTLDLGIIQQQALPKRLAHLTRALMGPNGTQLRRLAQNSDVLWARNLDMALIGRLLGSPLIYECLDIHSIMTDESLKGRVARKVERHFLRKAHTVVVSSPGFVTGYFGPWQGYEGPAALLENKLWFGTSPPPRPMGRARKPGPLQLGWVGAIRCAPSLSLLLAAAQALPDRIQLHIHGTVHDHAVPRFHDKISVLKNVRYHGPYDYPNDLAGIYGQLDLVWAQDLWQAGRNSQWLLPNRIYEAGWHGCPSLAVAQTQTGITLMDRGWGCVTPAATAGALVATLSDLSAGRLADLRLSLLSQPADRFQLSAAEVGATVDRLLTPARPASAVTDPVTL